MSDASKIIFDLFPFTKQTGHYSYVYYNGNKIYLNTYMCINKLRIYQLININSKPIERDRFVTANFQYVTSYKIWDGFKRHPNFTYSRNIYSLCISSKESHWKYIEGIKLQHITGTICVSICKELHEIRSIRYKNKHLLVGIHYKSYTTANDCSDYYNVHCMHCIFVFLIFNWMINKL